MRPGARPGRLAAAFVLLAAIAPELVSAAVETRSGTIEILTADDFERGRSERIVALVWDGGARTSLELPAGSDDLAPGTRVRVRGTPGPGRFAVEDLEVLEAPSLADPPGISGNSPVITILIKFLDTTTEPYTVAQIQNRMFAADGVADYFEEVSYGSHTLSGIVTTWLTATINTPTTCDPYTVSAQADARATDAGYNPYSYQKRVYVFPHIPCGWAGLGGGSQAWINQAASNLVVGHELGHCFGVGHSSSLDCGDAVLGSPCTVSEYGDPFSIMGNSQARHFPAYMKNQLGYFPAGTKATHGGGMAIYTLAPIEQAGGEPLRRADPARRPATDVLDRVPPADRLRRDHVGQSGQRRVDAALARLSRVQLQHVPARHDPRRTAASATRPSSSAKRTSTRTRVFASRPSRPTRRRWWCRSSSARRPSSASTGIRSRPTRIPTGCSRTARPRPSSRRTSTAAARRPP